MISVEINFSRTYTHTHTHERRKNVVISVARHSLNRSNNRHGTQNDITFNYIIYVETNERDFVRKLENPARREYVRYPSKLKHFEVRIELTSRVIPRINNMKLYTV